MQKRCIANIGTQCLLPREVGFFQHDISQDSSLARVASLLHCKFEVFVTFSTLVRFDITMHSGMLSYVPYICVCVLTVSTLYWPQVMKQKVRFEVTFPAERAVTVFMVALMMCCVGVYPFMECFL